MSAKLCRTKDRRDINHYSSYFLSMHKQTMKKASLDYLGVAIMVFVMAIVVLVVGLLTEDASHSKQIVFVATPCIFGISIILVCFCLRRFLIFQKINKIQGSKVQSVEIACKKVTFLFQQESKHSASIICIILTDENGRKYYNIVNGISDRAKKRIKAELLNAKVSLDCYANTNFVETYRVRTDHATL